MKTAAVCETGNVRKVNQDGLLVRMGTDGSRRYGLFLVADGMGGHADGGYASSVVVKCFDHWWEEGLKYILPLSYRDDEIMDKLKVDILGQIKALNENILTYSRERQIKTGTTLSLLFVFNCKCFFINIGDSRIYKASRKNLQKLTEDDTMAEVLFKSGAITRDEYDKHPGRNVLTKCIGIYNEAVPMMGELAICEGDRFFICSDGIYNYLTDKEIFKLVNGNDINDLQKGIDYISCQVKDRGAADNFTGIIVAPQQGKPKQKLITAFQKYINGLSLNR